jgi:hypothetical protein
MDIPAQLAAWVPAPLLALGFWFLLRRTLKDFEQKIESVFGKLEKALIQAQVHDTKIQLLEHRLTSLEKKRR